MAPPPMHFQMMQFQPIIPISELIYTLIVVFFCLFIYYRTRESFQLTGYKGIKHFRNIFLFLGVSYISRFLFHILTLSSITFDFFIPRGLLSLLSLLLVAYFGTLAISSMAYSVIWKSIKEKYYVIFSNILALAVVLFTIFFRSIDILVLVQFILLVGAIILSAVFHQKSKKLKNTLVIYSLIFVFWFMNIFLLLPRVFIAFELKAGLQLVSLGVFMVILYKITKWLK